MSTTESQLVYDQAARGPVLSLAERINALLLAIDGPIEAPICFTRTNILKRLSLEPTPERKEWVTGTFPELGRMGWRCKRLIAVTAEGEEILEFQRRH